MFVVVVILVFNHLLFCILHILSFIHSIFYIQPYDLEITLYKKFLLIFIFPLFSAAFVFTFQTCYRFLYTLCIRNASLKHLFNHKYNTNCSHYINYIKPYNIFQRHFIFVLNATMSLIHVGWGVRGVQSISRKCTAEKCG